MSKLIAAPAAQGNVATLFVGFELSKSTWLIGRNRCDGTTYKFCARVEMMSSVAD